LDFRAGQVQSLPACFPTLAGDPAYCREYRFFCDFVGVTENRTSSKSMSLIPKILPHAPPSRGVILFKWTAPNFGMFRIYEAYCAVNGFCVPHGFHDRGPCRKGSDLGVWG
jgi:hypothetical protein